MLDALKLGAPRYDPVAVPEIFRSRFAAPKISTAATPRAPCFRRRRRVAISLWDASPLRYASVYAPAGLPAGCFLFFVLFSPLVEIEIFCKVAAVCGEEIMLALAGKDEGGAAV